MRSIYTLTLSSTIFGNKSRGSGLDFLKWLDATWTDGFNFILWISSSFIYNLPLLERESWLCIFLQDDFFLVDLIKKNGLWRWNNCIWPGDDLSRKKKIKKNTMTDKYKQHAIATKMFTHSIHVRVVCQSAAIEHMDFVRDSWLS